jgi:amino acid permease
MLPRRCLPATPTTPTTSLRTGKSSKNLHSTSKLLPLLHSSKQATHELTTTDLHRRNLRWYHILLIVLSGTIGMGLFENSGSILGICGPGGGLTAYIVVGFFVICVMEGLAEMVTHWPISNAMVEFVSVFVDREGGVVVGVAYAYVGQGG